MTKISFESYYDNFYFDCSGHAEYQSAGPDILCSAISILCYTLDSFLEGAFLEGRISDYSSDFRSGCVHIEFSASDCPQRRELLMTVYALLNGFSLLEESFPSHVSTDF